MTDFDSEPDGPMTPEQEARVRALTPAELHRIDEALLSNAAHQFYKVARVVSRTMSELGNDFPELPDVFYASRIKHLVASGQLEAAGTLDRMRFSEVRLASPKSIQ